MLFVDDLSCLMTMGLRQTVNNTEFAQECTYLLIMCRLFVVTVLICIAYREVQMYARVCYIIYLENLPENLSIVRPNREDTLRYRFVCDMRMS